MSIVLDTIAKEGTDLVDTANSLSKLGDAAMVLGASTLADKLHKSAFMIRHSVQSMIDAVAVEAVNKSKP